MGRPLIDRALSSAVADAPGKLAWKRKAIRADASVALVATYKGDVLVLVSAYGQEAPAVAMLVHPRQPLVLDFGLLARACDVAATRCRRA